jgi:hypothetical protein
MTRAKTIPKKVKPIPVKIVSDLGMSKGPHDPASPDKTMKPSMSFDCSPTMEFPKIGAKVRVTVTGTVLEVSRRKDRYGDGRPKGRIEIEYPGMAAVKVESVGASVDDIDDSDEALRM